MCCITLDIPKDKEFPYVLHYSRYYGKTSGVGEKRTFEVDIVIGVDEANSKVAKAIDSGDYEYAIAFQLMNTDNYVISGQNGILMPN
ncbi:hypothetical protein TanjilG_20291 [Lupinus angustifolius]|uniref:Uncharacterized protein n=1 Tax=Lupinus angustifolius TaxID=3871 RepID=A0A1J7IRK0_LUPAN|nr:hypothetical protein TanjilG_20291 [Lupinus angustifolius]